MREDIMTLVGIVAVLILFVVSSMEFHQIYNENAVPTKVIEEDGIHSIIIESDTFKISTELYDRLDEYDYFFIKHVN